MSAALPATELLSTFYGRLSAPERAVLDLARRVCDVRGWPLYLVGGAVRDLLLARPHLDIDLAVDVEPRLLVSALARETELRATEHPAFQTATVAGPGWTIDLARTRTERYPQPGALPEVSPAPIQLDLLRRDFTVHALAIGLAGAEQQGVIDPLSGRKDLDAGLLRVIHDASFSDDPTRLLRLARYQTRLGFRIEEHTGVLARRDAAYLETLSPARIGHELLKLVHEARPEDCFACLRDLHALRRIYPRLEASAALHDRYDRLRRDGGPAPGAAEYLAVQVTGWDRGSMQQLIDRVALDHATASVLRDVPGATRVLAEAAGSADPAAIVARFEQVRLGALRGAAAVTGGARYDLVRRYLTEWQHVRPALRGDDLLAMGVPPGPRIGEALDALRGARLRGEARTVQDERELVARLCA